MSDFPLFFSEDQYNEYMDDLRAPRYESEYAQAAAELGNDEYQRLIGGGDYNYTCERCGGRCNTGSEHTADECFENRVDHAADELSDNIAAAAIELYATANSEWANTRAALWLAIDEATYEPMPF